MIRRSLSIFFWTIFFLLLTIFVSALGFFETWRTERVTAQMESQLLTSVREPIVIDFSRAMRASSLVEQIKLTPPVAMQTQWQDFGKRLILTPEEPWALDASYTLDIGRGRTTWFVATDAFSFSVNAPRLPKLVMMTPADGATDVLLGVEDPIQVTFDRSVRDFYIDFQFDPPIEVVSQHNPEKTSFSLLPKESLQPGKEYRLNIQARLRHEAEAKYYPIARSAFTTLPPQLIRASQDFGTRVAEAKRFTRPKETLGKYIDVNIATQVMTLFEDGRAVDAYMISSGKAGMDTPKGSFKIENQALRPWSKRYSLYMPHWQAITADGLYGIHELPEWPGGYKEGADHLGMPVSHGCIRLGVGAAKRVYEWASVGTPVIIY